MKFRTLCFAVLLRRGSQTLRLKSLLFGLAAVLGFATVANAALTHAPLTLYYSVTPTDGKYQYDFSLVLDNNDGSWVPGQMFNWIIVGDAQNAPSPFEADTFRPPVQTLNFFTKLPPNTFHSYSGGFHNGPTICWVLPTGNSCGLDAGFQPTVLGETLHFSGLGSVFLGQGDLLWSRLLAGPNGAFSNAFLVANLITPLPAALPLFVTGLGALGLLGWRRKKARKRRQSVLDRV